MDPILPDFPWFPYLRISDLPEAKLIYAIILAAWEDSNKAFECPVRAEARRWFFTDQFRDLCQMLYLPVYAIQERATLVWSIE